MDDEIDHQKAYEFKGRNLYESENKHLHTYITWNLIIVWNLVWSEWKKSQRQEDAMLVVYLADGKTVYMETGISADRLSLEMQQKAKQGIGFSDLEQLYDFLESYAS